MAGAKITEQILRQMKGRTPLAALTVYDYAMAKLLDSAGIPLLLVGDSLGMVVLGYPDTTWVTIEEMEHHVRAAARAKPRAFLTADLPYRAYDSPDQAVRNARRLLAAGAEAVKAEGGAPILPQLQAFRAEGIAFCGHIGMLPQNIHLEGSYSIKGKSAGERDQLLRDAETLAQAGAFAVVLELVAPAVAREITARIPIPTIGIGAGPHCDGQILVTPDLWGTSPDYIPKHVKLRKDLKQEMLAAVAEWKSSLTPAPA